MLHAKKKSIDFHSVRVSSIHQFPFNWQISFCSIKKMLIALHERNGRHSGGGERETEVGGEGGGVEGRDSTQQVKDKNKKNKKKTEKKIDEQLDDGIICFCSRPKSTEGMVDVGDVGDAIQAPLTANCAQRLVIRPHSLSVA